MRKIGIILLLILWTGVFVQAQPGRRMEKIRAIKVAFITDKLQLTSEQSARFWPVYNRFEEDRFTIIRTYRKERGMADGSVDEDPIRSVDNDIAMQEKMLDLRKRYKEEFLRVISPQQLATLIEAEREFKKLLLEQIRERRDEGKMRRRQLR